MRLDTTKLEDDLQRAQVETLTAEAKVRAAKADLVRSLGAQEVVDYAGDTYPVRMHDGSTILLKKVDPDYDPTRRNNALGYLERYRSRGQIVTGLLYIDQNVVDMHAQSRTAATAFKDMDFEQLNPGSQALAELQQGMR